MAQTLLVPNSQMTHHFGEPIGREVSPVQSCLQAIPQSHTHCLISKQTPSQQMQGIITELNVTIQQMTEREALLTQELHSCTQLLQKYRQESCRLGTKVQQLQTLLAKDNNRSTSGHQGSSLSPDDQNFGIGDDQQIDIGQSCTNLQLKESFNILRCSVEKLFNEDEITLSVVRLLPRQLEDDFQDFVGYVREKIVEIRNGNNLSFIQAENGEEPSLMSLEQELVEFVATSSTECNQLKRVIEEKDCTINSLLNEKTEQENTINQQQTAQEETERLYLQQFSVLKGEIHVQKQTIDKQTVYLESLRNIIKKMMFFWVDQDDNFDDFQDNLTLLTTMYVFSPKEMDLLRNYLGKYKQIKCAQE